jgi:hypothetical protein
MTPDEASDLISTTLRDLISLRGDPNAYYARLRQYGADIEAVTDAQVELMLLLAYDQFSTCKLDEPTLRAERVAAMFAAVKASEEGTVSKQYALDVIRDSMLPKINFEKKLD